VIFGRFRGSTFSVPPVDGERVFLSPSLNSSFLRVFVRESVAFCGVA